VRVHVNCISDHYEAFAIPSGFVNNCATRIGLLESVGGACLIVGVLTRPFAILFIGEMIGVLITTKVSLFLGQSTFLPLQAVAGEYGAGSATRQPKVVWIAMYLDAKSTDPKLAALRGYTPAQAKVHVGDHVVFLNIDDEPHTATLRLAEGFPATATKSKGHMLSQAWSTGDIKADGQSAPLLADKVGTYAYGCAHHFSDGQRGTIIVAP